MDFSTLPLETQVDFLLDLDPADILNYCQTNSSANEICQSSWFWDQKGLRQFGIPPSILCQMSPYWRYRFVHNINEHELFLGPLVRGGLLDRAAEHLQSIDQYAALNIAIGDDDIETLRFLEPFLQTLQPSDKRYDPTSLFATRLDFAFYEGSPQAIAYLDSLDPRYLKDPIVLDRILGVLVVSGLNREIALLRPYIERMVENTPDLSEILASRPYLRDYYLKNLA